MNVKDVWKQNVKCTTYQFTCIRGIFIIFQTMLSDVFCLNSYYPGQRPKKMKTIQ